MEDSLDANGETPIDIAIAIAFAAGVLICAIANAVILGIAVVSNHTYRGKIMVSDHPRAEDPSSGPELCAELKNKFVYTELLQINCAGLRR